MLECLTRSLAPSARRAVSSLPRFVACLSALIYRRLRNRIGALAAAGSGEHLEPDGRRRGHSAASGAAGRRPTCDRRGRGAAEAGEGELSPIGPAARPMLRERRRNRTLDL